MTNRTARRPNGTGPPTPDQEAADAQAHPPLTEGRGCRNVTVRAGRSYLIKARLFAARRARPST